MFNQRFKISFIKINYTWFKTTPTPYVIAHWNYSYNKPRAHKVPSLVTRWAYASSKTVPSLGTTFVINEVALAFENQTFTFGQASGY